MTEVSRHLGAASGAPSSAVAAAPACPCSSLERPLHIADPGARPACTPLTGCRMGWRRRGR